MTIQVTVLSRTSSSVLVKIYAESHTPSDSWHCMIDNRQEVVLTASADRYSATGRATVLDGEHAIYVTNGVDNERSNFTTVIPVVNFTVVDVQLHSITINATSDIPSDLWRFSKDGGVTYINLESPSTYSSRTYTFNNLNVNTEYLIKVGARNPNNDIYGYTGSIAVKTQGGISHLIVNDVWKSAVAYVIVDGAWKQAIGYTLSNGSWRIGT